MAKTQSPRPQPPAKKPNRKPAAPGLALPALPPSAADRAGVSAPETAGLGPAVSQLSLAGRVWRQAAWIGAVIFVIGFIFEDSVLRYRSLDMVTNSVIGLGRPVGDDIPEGAPLTGASSRRMGLKPDPTTPSGFEMDQHSLIVPALGTDGYHWMMQTERELLNGGVRLRHSDYDNPTTGREIHWSGFLHWWTLGVAWLWTQNYPDVPMSQAIAEVGPWANTLLLVVLLVVLAPLVARRFGWLPAALLAIGFMATYPLFEFFTTGYLDHHGLAAVFSMLMVLFLAGGGAGWLRPEGAVPGDADETVGELWKWLPERRAARRWFIASGIMGGAGLWISAASLVPAMFGIGLSALVGTMLLGRNSPAGSWRCDPTLWRVWGFAGAVTSIFFYLLEYFPSHFGMRLEVNHPLYALAWAGAGDLICRVSQWWHRAQRGRWAADFPWVGAAVDLVLIAALPVMILLFKESMFAITNKFLWALHEDYILEFRSLSRQLTYLTPVQIAGGISMVSLLVFGATVMLWNDDFKPLAGMGWRALVLAALVPGLLVLHSVMFPLVNGALDHFEMVPITTQGGKTLIEQAKISTLNNPSQKAANDRIIMETQRQLDANEARARNLAYFADLVVFALLFVLPAALGPPLLPRPWKAVLLLTLVPALVMLVLALRQVRWLGIGCALWLAVLVALLAIAMRVRYMNGRLVLMGLLGVLVAVEAGLTVIEWQAVGACVLLYGLVCGLGRYLGGYGRPALVLAAVLPPMFVVLFAHGVNLLFTDFINWTVVNAAEPLTRLAQWNSFLEVSPWALAVVSALVCALWLARGGMKREEWIQLATMAGVLWLFAGASHIFGSNDDYSTLTVFAAGLAALVAMGKFTARPGVEPVGSLVAGLMLALVLLPYPCFTLYQWNAGGWRYPPGQLEVTQVITRDVSAKLRKRLGSEPGGIVSGPTTTTWMTYFGGFKGLGTLYWENIDGLKATADIYSARSTEEAYALVKKHNISHIAVYSWDPFFIEYVRLARGIRLNVKRPDEGPQDAFITKLLNNQLRPFPPWLKPVPYRMVNMPGLEYAYVKIYEVVPPQSLEEVAVAYAQYQLELDQYNDATNQLNAVLRQMPDYLPALSLLAYVQYKAGNVQQFQTLTARVIELLPRSTQKLSLNDRVQLAMVLALGRNNTLAREQMAAAVAEADEDSLRKLPPYLLVNFHGLSRQLGLGDLRPEIMDFAWDLLPSENRADALTDRASMEAQGGAFAESVAHFKEALREYPNHPVAINRLAWLYATHPDASVRNADEAVRLARQSLQLSLNAFRQAAANLNRASMAGGGAGLAQPQQAFIQARTRLWESYDIFAAALAERGEFAKAVNFATQARQLAQEAGEAGAALSIMNRLMLYQQGKPYHNTTAQQPPTAGLNAPTTELPQTPPQLPPGLSPFQPSQFSPVPPMAPPMAPAPSPGPPAPSQQQPGSPFNLR